MELPQHGFGTVNLGVEFVAQQLDILEFQINSSAANKFLQ
jgi:hypothetical protein